MKRIIPVLAMIAALAAPAVASAHQADPPHLSCAELDGHFTNFPAGTQGVTLHYSVDGIVQPDVVISGQGPNFDTSFGYYNPDRNVHTVSARFTWTADGGGASPITTTTIANCPPPASQEQITILQNQINELYNQQITILNRVTNIENHIRTLSCTSNRRYAFLIRQTVDGVPVVGVDHWLVRNQREFGSFTVVQRGGANRFRFVADYSGLEVPRGQVRTAVVFVNLANGQQARLVQKLRLCLEQDGPMNERTAQGRATS
jgi:hypothetical protein